MFKEIVDTMNGNARRRANAKVAIGVSIGVLVGAAAGIILAPKSGKETRKDIKHGAEKTVEKAQDVAHIAKKLVKKEVDAVNKTVATKANDVKTNLKQTKEAPKAKSQKTEEDKKT